MGRGRLGKHKDRPKRLVYLPCVEVRSLSGEVYFNFVFPIKGERVMIQC